MKCCSIRCSSMGAMIPLSIKSGFEPVQILAFNRDHVKSTWGCLAQFQQEMTGCKHNPSLLGRRDAGQGPAVVLPAALAHLHKNERPIGVADDQIYFAAASPRRPIIALHQLQTLRL